MGHQADAGVRGDDRLGGPSLSEDVYWQLRKEIVRGDLRPNQPLAEIDIARPVAEAAVGADECQVPQAS